MKVIINNAQELPQKLEQALAFAKAQLMAGRKMQIEVKKSVRSLEANARLHATISDVASQIEWAGKRRDVETWKRLLTAAWLRARGESVELLPALDGHGVDVVFARTSKLTAAECSELCEFIYAWGTERGVRFTCPELEAV